MQAAPQTTVQNQCAPPVTAPLARTCSSASGVLYMPLSRSSCSLQCATPARLNSAYSAASCSRPGGVCVWVGGDDHVVEGGLRRAPVSSHVHQLTPACNKTRTDQSCARQLAALKSPGPHHSPPLHPSHLRASWPCHCRASSCGRRARSVRCRTAAAPAGPRPRLRLAWRPAAAARAGRGPSARRSRAVCVGGGGEGEVNNARHWFLVDRRWCRTGCCARASSTVAQAGRAGAGTPCAGPHAVMRAPPCMCPPAC